jgi:hypothetical protein
MKKVLSLVALICLISCFLGCGGGDDTVAVVIRGNVLSFGSITNLSQTYTVSIEGTDFTTTSQVAVPIGGGSPNSFALQYSGGNNYLSLTPGNHVFVFRLAGQTDGKYTLNIPSAQGGEMEYDLWGIALENIRVKSDGSVTVENVKFAPSWIPTPGGVTYIH